MNSLAFVQFPEPPKKPWGAKPFTGKVWLGVTEESIKAFEAKIAEYEQQVAAIKKDHVAVLNRAVETLAGQGFPKVYTVQATSRTIYKKWKSTTLRDALLGFLPPRPPSVTVSSERAYLEALRKDRLAEEEARALAVRRDAAVQWLLARGKVYGEDFTATDAEWKADEIARDEEITKVTAASGWIAFNGKNCNGPCLGWDGQSHRCDCGNRRVSWCTDEMHFDGGYVYAEAY